MTLIVNQHLHFLRTFVALSVFFIGMCVNQAWAAEQAGKILVTRGQVWAQLGEQPGREMKRGANVFVGDQIVTGDNASLKLRFNDGSITVLGAGANMSISSFNNEDENPSLEATIELGAFRFISGLIAKNRPEAVSVSTTVATIGIRGTDFSGEITPTSARIVLNQPEDDTENTAIEVYNKFGTVLIEQPGYGTDIPDQYSPPSPPRRMRLRTVTNLMRSLQNIQRMQVPRRPIR